MSRRTHVHVFVVLLHLAELCFSQGPIVTSATYSKISFKISEDDHFGAFSFVVTFDQELYVKGVPLANLSRNSTTGETLCWPGFACINMPDSIFHLLGTAQLVCGNTIVESKVSSPDESVPTYLVPEPPSGDPFQTLMYYIGAVDEASLQLNPRQLSYLYIFNFRKYGLRFITPYNRIGEQVIETGNCSLRFLPTSGLTNQNGDPINSNADITFTRFQPACDYAALLPTITAINSTLYSIANGTTWEELDGALWKAATLSQSHNYRGCIELVSRLLVQERRSKIALNSTACAVEEGSQEWNSDPCCNRSLTFYECCAPRMVNFTIDAFADIRKKDIESQCVSVTNAELTLKDYASFATNAHDPTIGCVASTEANANSLLFGQYNAFLEECNICIYGQQYRGYPCETDADCYTKCLEYEGICDIPWDQPDPYLLECYFDNMNPVVATYLRDELDIPASASKEEFNALLFNKLADYNCVGQTARYYTFEQAPDGKQIYVQANKTECLGDLVCSYWATLPLSQCEDDGNYTCVYCRGKRCFSFSSPTFCAYANTIDVSTPKGCAAMGGTWDPFTISDSCRIDNFTTEEACLPSSICPNRNIQKNVDTWYRKYYCADSFCYEPRLNSSILCNNARRNCTDELVFWDSQKANGSGLCIYGQVFDSARCNAVGGVWWPGRSWIDGVYNTKDTCEAGTCTSRIGYSIAPNGTECSSIYACTKQCSQCLSTVQRTLCFDSLGPSLNACDCHAAGGSADLIHDICLYITYSNETACTTAGHTWQSCSISPADCILCQNNDTRCPVIQDLLKCQLSWYTPCYDEASCLAYGGWCNDGEFFNKALTTNNSCFIFSEFQSNPDCTGACVFPYSVSDGGVPYCANSLAYEGRTACIDYSITTPDECGYYGGEWHRMANRTEAGCLAHGVGCRDNDSEVLYPNMLSQKPPEECAKCNGQVEPFYKWTPGKWQPTFELPLYWVKKGTVPYNSWNLTLNYTKLSTAVNSAVATRIAFAVQTQALCLYSAELETVKAIACDCTESSNGIQPSNCFESGARTVAFGIQKFCAGVSDAVKVGPLQLEIRPGTVALSDNCVLVDLAVTAASQFELSKEEILSSNLLSGSLADDPNPYAVVVNKNDVTVGQLVGDGVVLKITGAATGHFAQTARLCIALRRDIDHSSEFDEKDFAKADKRYKKWSPLNAKIQTVVQQDDNGRTSYYCAEVKEPGTYFPIKRIDNWEDAQPTSKLSDVEGFIYLIAALYFAIAVGVAVSLVLVIILTGITVVTLQKAILSILFIFCVLRGVYLAITPSGQLDNESISAYYVVGELPVYLFFSIYSLLVFLWAELYHWTSAQHTPFLHQMKWPFIITNGVIYVFFVALLIAFSESSRSSKPLVAAVYKIIVAVISVVITVGFWVYGGRLLWMRAKMQQAHTRSHRVLIKMSAVVGACTFGLLLQCAFLIYTSFKDVSSIALALVYFVIVEIVPASVLLVSLRKRPPKKGASSPSAEKAATSKTRSAGPISSRESTKEHPNAAEFERIEVIETA